VSACGLRGDRTLRFLFAFLPSPSDSVSAERSGAQPEGAFLNLVNWIGNVIAPVGAGLALAGGLISYVAGRGSGRYVVTALGCLAVSGVTRLLEFWIAQGGGGVS
jgi:hypothetical protein